MRHPSSDQAVGSVGANRKPRDAGAIGRLHTDPCFLGRDVQDASSDQRRPSPALRQRRARHRNPRGWIQRGRTPGWMPRESSSTDTERPVAASMKRARLIGVAARRCGTDASATRERPAGHSAAAGLLARMQPSKMTTRAPWHAQAYRPPMRRTVQRRQQRRQQTEES